MQILTHQINDLALDQLATLSYNLKELDETRQTRVLLQAVKVLSGTRKHQLASLSMEHRIFLLNAFGSELDFCADLIKDSWRDRFEIAAPSTVVGLLGAIGHAYRTTVATTNNDTTHKNVTGAPFRRHKPLEDFCINFALRKLNRLRSSEIESLLIACRQFCIYNTELFDNIARQYADTDSECTFGERLTMWAHLCAVQYYHSVLSTDILQHVLSDSSALKSLSTEHCLTLLRLIGEKYCTEYDAIGRPFSERLDADVRCLLNNIDEKIAGTTTEDIQPGSYTTSLFCAHLSRTNQCVHVDCLI